MPARAPGERPAEGETIQEQDLEHRRERRDQLARDPGQQSPAKRATWLDYMPSGAPMPPFLSHDELIEAVKRFHGIELTAATLTHWRNSGVLPRPIKRRHNGVTQPVYPLWYVNAIAKIRELQDAGWSLAEIAAAMQADWPERARDWSGVDPLYLHVARAYPALLELARATGVASISKIEVRMYDRDGQKVFDHPYHLPEE